MGNIFRHVGGYDKNLHLRNIHYLLKDFNNSLLIRKKENVDRDFSTRDYLKFLIHTCTILVSTVLNNQLPVNEEEFNTRKYLFLILKNNLKLRILI